MSFSRITILFLEFLESFLGSIRNDAEYDTYYQGTVEKAGHHVTKSDQKINYKQLYFQVIVTIVGMLNERLKGIESFGFLILSILTFLEVGEEKYNPIKLSFSRKGMDLYWTSQCLKAN